MKLEDRMQVGATPEEPPDVRLAQVLLRILIEGLAFAGFRVPSGFA